MANADKDAQEGGELRTALIASFAFLVVLAGGAAPIPLYTRYQETLGFGDAAISLTIVSYLLGIVLVLFFAGSLSDAVGRRPLAALSLLLCIAGCALFLNLRAGPMLQAARFVQGLASALAMSATSAWIIDAAQERHHALAVAMSSCGVLLGISAGSLATGLLGGAFPDGRPVYLGIIVLAAAALALLPFARETARGRCSLREAARPILGVPASLRRVFPLAAGLYICCWGVCMFFQSLGATATAHCFGTTGTLVPALTLALALAPSILGSPLEARLEPKASLGLTVALLALSCAGVVASMAAGALAPFLAFDALFGFSTGIGLSLAMRLLLAEAGGDENAGLVSLINFTAYLGSTLMSAAMSALVSFMPYTGLFAFMGAVGIAAILAGALATRRRTQAEG